MPRFTINNDPTGSDQGDVNSDGTFDLWGAGPGDYQLLYETQRGGYQMWQDIVHVKDRSPVEGIEIRLP